MFIKFIKFMNKIKAFIIFILIYILIYFFPSLTLLPLFLIILELRLRYLITPLFSSYIYFLNTLLLNTYIFKLFSTILYF